MVTPVVKRDAVAHLQVFQGISERRACQVLGADWTTIRYCSRRADDEDLREKLRALAQQRRRFGYRRLHILLRRDGIAINRKKAQRLGFGQCPPALPPALPRSRADCAVA